MCAVFAPRIEKSEPGALTDICVCTAGRREDGVASRRSMTKSPAYPKGSVLFGHVDWTIPFRMRLNCHRVGRRAF